MVRVQGASSLVSSANISSARPSRRPRDARHSNRRLPLLQHMDTPYAFRRLLPPLTIPLPTTRVGNSPSSHPYPPRWRSSRKLFVLGHDQE
ncbi:hypothetical protein M8818_006104 [Zalaria obscura]|uniref:Uncharacterized protein n=1 Tax=Zalaria obscura TaxID=2024903 RepID=A0ACC3S7D2_9PEZI